MLCVSVGEIEGPEDAAGDCGVGCDERTVGEEVWIEDEEGQGDQCCERAEHLVPCGEYADCEGQHEDCGGHSCAEENLVGVVAEDEVFGAEESFGLEGASLEGWYI